MPLWKYNNYTVQSCNILLRILLFHYFFYLNMLGWNSKPITFLINQSIILPVNCQKLKKHACHISQSPKLLLQIACFVPTTDQKIFKLTVMYKQEKATNPQVWETGKTTVHFKHNYNASKICFCCFKLEKLILKTVKAQLFWSFVLMLHVAHNP